MGRAPKAALGSGVGFMASDMGQKIDANTVAAIQKFGKDVLAPHIKAEAQKQFMSGVQAAMEGKALKDIVEEQPWYSQIFGPSSAVQGAQAYTAQAKIAEFGATLEREMPELARQPASVLTDRLAELQKEMLTGDDVVDAALTRQMVDQMAPVYKRHAKEHYIHMQEQAVAAQGKAWAEEAGHLQSAMQGAMAGTVSAEDVEAAQQRMRNALTPFGDQTVDSYHQNLLRFVENAAVSGNFHVVKMLKDDGLMEQLPVQLRSNLDRALATAGRKTLDQALLSDPNLAMEYAMLLNDTAQNPRNFAERAAALNKRAADFTGVTEARLLDGMDIVQGTGGILRAQAAARAAGPSAAEREEAGIARALTALMQPGGLALAKANPESMGGTSEQQNQAAITMFWAREGDPGERAKAMNLHPTVKFAPAEQDFKLPLGLEGDSPGMQHAAATYSQLSQLTRDTYLDAEEQAFYDAYLQHVNANQDPQAAFVAAQQVRKMKTVPQGDASSLGGSVRKVLSDRYDGTFQWWLGKPDRVSGEDLEVLNSVAYSSALAAGGPSSMEVKARVGLSAALASGQVDLVGGVPVVGGANKHPLNRVFLYGKNNLSAEEAAEALDGFLTARPKERGMGDVLGRLVIRMQDYTPEGAEAGHKEAQFFVTWTGVGDDGLTKEYSEYVSSEQIKAQFRSAKKKAAVQQTNDMQEYMERQGSRGTIYRQQ